MPARRDQHRPARQLAHAGWGAPGIDRLEIVEGEVQQHEEVHDVFLRHLELDTLAHYLSSGRSIDENRAMQLGETGGTTIDHVIAANSHRPCHCRPTAIDHVIAAQQP